MVTSSGGKGGRARTAITFFGWPWSRLGRGHPPGYAVRKRPQAHRMLPDADVAAAGGWRELESLRQCYQQADEATMLEVVLSGGKLMESKG